MEQFIENKHTGWFQRFKNAIAGIIFAPVFGVLGFLMIYAGERDHAKTTIALKTIEKKIVKDSTVHEGDLFWFCDTVGISSETLEDSEFGLSINAIKLYRRVFSWQWVEIIDERNKKTSEGGEDVSKTYNYEQRWMNDLINSNDFKYPTGHENPEYRKYYSKLFEHNIIKIGKYKLDNELYYNLLNLEPLDIDTFLFTFSKNWLIDSSQSKCPGNELDLVFSKASYSNEKYNVKYIFIGQGNPKNPKIGDIKVEYWSIPGGIYSVIGMKKGESIVPLKKDSLFIYGQLPCGGVIHSPDGMFGIIMKGNVTVEQMFEDLHDSNDRIFIFLRFAGLLFTVAGFLILGYPLQVLFAFLPFVGKIWEKIIFKLMLTLGSFIAFTVSIYFYLSFNNIGNLTIWDLYYVLLVILFILFANNLRASVKSGRQEIYNQQF